MAVALGAGPTAGDDGSTPAQWVVRLWGALPVVSAAVAARQVSGLGDAATAAGERVMLVLSRNFDARRLVWCSSRAQKSRGNSREDARGRGTETAKKKRRKGAAEKEREMRKEKQGKER